MNKLQLAQGQVSANLYVFFYPYLWLLGGFLLFHLLLTPVKLDKELRDELATAASRHEQASELQKQKIDRFRVTRAGRIEQIDEEGRRLP